MDTAVQPGEKTRPVRIVEIGASLRLRELRFTWRK
jgi:hypothetical protein